MRIIDIRHRRLVRFRKLHGVLLVRTHMIYAYRFTDDSGITTENFCSDGDYGLGLELLKLMRESDNTNVVCVTTRTCSPDYVHLGRKRFQYVRDTATGAIQKLSDKV